MRRREGGMILPALLILLLIGSIAVMLSGNDLAARVELQHHQATIAQLAAARAALIGYAQSYHLTHSGQSVGYLPCPDLDSATDEGSAEWNWCGNKNDFAIGRFPHRTLGLPPLRDGYGECLWYAVAGSFKNKPKGDTMNWDTAGQFSISHGSRSLVPALPGDQLAVAVIFAPGRPLAGQDRGSSTRRCSGDANSAIALQAYLEGATAVPSSAAITLTSGQPTGSINNDILVWITANDVFSKHFVNTMLNSLESALKKHPNPEPTNSNPDDNIKTGGFPLPIPPPSLPLSEAEEEAEAERKMINDTLTGYKLWADHFRYFFCDDGSECLSAIDNTVNPPVAQDCRAVFVFAGHALPTQVREGSSGATAQYFEGDNVIAIDSVTSPLYGGTAYDTDNPTKDLARCVNLPDQQPMP